MSETFLAICAVLVVAFFAILMLAGPHAAEAFLQSPTWLFPAQR